MSTVSIPGKNLQFYFTDTGAPANVKDYTTFIVIHGHTYHANLFRRLLPLAAPRSVRMICVNRREYPGTTPYTAEELRIWASGSSEERTALLREVGIDHALCTDEIIKQCALPPAGPVALVAWSLGNVFNLGQVSSILSIPSEARERLQTYVKAIVLWDPPSQALGIVSPVQGYVPLYDTDIAPAERGPAFGRWVSSYFVHPNLAAHDPSQLNYRTPDPARKSTFEELPFPELLEITDFSVGDKCDTILVEPPMQPIVKAVVDKALFDPEIRAAWKNAKFHYSLGTSNPWNGHWALWDVEERHNNTKGKAPIVFHSMEGANHFAMWDFPSESMDWLISCMSS